jgi:cobalt-zinc-cadmium efflux system protein
MEGTPRGLELTEVAATIRSIEGVRDVHHLNIWTVCSHILSLSAHVDIDSGNEARRITILHAIEHQLADRFHITHTTIQMECATCADGPMIKEWSHQKHSHSHCH